ELAFVRDEPRQRDREPFLRLARAATRERRGPRELPRLPERSPEPRVFHIVRPREGPRETLAPRRSVKSRVRTGRVARLYVRPRGHGPRPEILEQEHVPPDASERAVELRRPGMDESLEGPVVVRLVSHEPAPCRDTGLLLNLAAAPRRRAHGWMIRSSRVNRSSLRSRLICCHDSRASSTEPSSSMVEMSPGSLSRITAFKTRRMIFPLRVF